MTPSELIEPGVRVVSNAGSGLEGYPGVFCFSRGLTLIMSAPPKAVPALAESALVLSGASISEVDALRLAVGGEARRVIGPAFQGFVDGASFTPSLGAHAVVDAGLKHPGLGELRVACGEADWDTSGISHVSGQLAVVVENDRVVGAAGLRTREEGVVDPCVLIHPDRRGVGLATALVGHVTGMAVRRGDLVLYQTLLANSPAVQLAERLGFEHYATTVAIRPSE